jgi:WD40 repeat protein/serine/threonine protein kinase
MRHRDIFLTALDLPTAERAAFLDRACGADPELRRLVEELLLSHDQAGSFLEHPALTDPSRTVGEGVATPDVSATAAGTEMSAAVAPDDLSFLGAPVAPGCLGRLGHYDVREVVGRGGMGVVLKAVDTKLQRVVAIKVLAPQLAASGTARQRFLREAHAAAAVRDDHVVGIYAVEEEGPVPYLVMEYIAGVTLDDRIKQGGALGVKEVLRIGMQVARGLAAAHEQGLIHRDIKPANILLENGVQRVKLTDFGLARAADDASLTQSGVIAGTPMYMSPEQAEGRPVDARTDLFSLGSVMYAMCTGRPPFRAETTMAVLKRVCEEAPRPIREVNPDIPDWLAAIVMKLLAKDPAQRFPSAREVADLLGQYLAHLQQPDLVARPPSVTVTERAPRRREQAALKGVQAALIAMGGCGMVAGLLLAVLGALLTVGFVVYLFHGSPPPPRIEPREEERPPPPLAPEELAKLPSPLDGRKRDDIPRGLLTLVGGGDPAQAPPELVAVLGDGRFLLPGDGPAREMAQSPDGKLLAVCRGNLVVLFDRDSGQLVRTLTGHGGRVYTIAFSPAGRLLASGCREGADHDVRLWDVATGRLKQTLAGNTEEVNALAFSADGRRLFVALKKPAIRVWDTETGQPEPALEGHTAPVRSLALSPDGKYLASGGSPGDLRVRVWDAQTGQPRQTLTGPTGYAITGLAFSPDGQWLAAGASGGWALWDMRQDFKETAANPQRADWLAFTPDSKTLLIGPVPESADRDVARGSDNADSGPHTLVVWDLPTLKEKATYTLNGRGGYPSYLLDKDGKTLFAFRCNPVEPLIRVYDLTTGKERPRQGHTERRVWTVAFSPDGKFLASAGDGGKVLLWDLAAWHPGEPLPPVRELTGHTATVWSVAFSPDGKLLASVSSGGVILWNVADGGTFRTLPGRHAGGSNVAFSPDGKKLAFGWEDGTVWQCDVASGVLGVGLPLHQGVVSAVAFSPDGRTLATKGETDGAVRLTNMDTNNVHHIGSTIWGKRHPDFGLAFSPDGKTLAITAEKDVRLWDVEKQTETTLAGHTDWLHGVAFHPAGRLLASASDDHTVRLWDLSSPGRVRTLGPGPFGHMAREVAFDPTGRYFATSNWNGTVTIFRTPELPPPHAPGQPKPPPDPKELAAKPAAADALKRDDIHPGQRKGLPPEVVAVLGGPAFALPEGEVSGMTVSADGKRLAVPCGDKVVIFDAHTGLHLRTLKDPTGKVSCAAFSPDGKRLATGSWTDKVHNVRVWDTQTGESAVSFAAHTGVVNALAFSPDGTRLASASADGFVWVWAKVWNGTDDLVLKGHKGPVLCVAFSPDGKRIATAGEDKTVRLWDTDTGKPIKELEGHSGDVLSVAFSPDGKLLASGSREEWKLWDAGTLKEVHTATRPPGDWLAFAPDGQSFWAAAHKASLDLSRGRDLTRWGVDGKLLDSFDPKVSRGFAYYALNPDGRILYVNEINKGGTLRTYDAATGAERAPQGHAEKLTAAAVSPDGALLASAGEDALVKLWDLSTGELKHTLRGHGAAVLAVAFSPDGKRLASQGKDGTLRLWDPARGKEVMTLDQCGRADGRGLAFSPDGRWLASASDSDGGVRLWDAAAGRLVRTLRGHARATRLAFSPDSRLLACGGNGAIVRVWDVDDGWEVRALSGPGLTANNVAFSPDGRWLAAGGDDGTMKRWDVKAWGEVRGPWQFAGPLEGLAYSPDGRLLIAATPDGTVRMADLTGQLSREWSCKLPAGCAGAVFTPEGRYLAVPALDGMVYVLRLGKRGE